MRRAVPALQLVEHAAARAIDAGEPEHLHRHAGLLSEIEPGLLGLRPAPRCARCWAWAASSRRPSGPPGGHRPRRSRDSRSIRATRAWRSPRGNARAPDRLPAPAGSNAADASCRAAPWGARCCRPRRSTGRSRSRARQDGRSCPRRARFRRSASLWRRAAPPSVCAEKPRPKANSRLTPPLPSTRFCTAGSGSSACAARNARKRCGARRDSAHTAMARTSGEASSSRASTRGTSAASPELPAAISTLRRKRSRPVRLIGVPRKRARNAASSRSEQLGERRVVAFGSHAELRLARALREFVPRADGEAIVAAEDAVAHRCAEARRDMPLMLDGEVGDAGARIDLVGRGEGVRRANVETAPAGPAMILLGRVGLDLGGGEDRADEQPRAELARDEIGVLALPAEPGARGERLLHHRRGIDEQLHLALRERLHARGERLELRLEHVVIVGALRVDRDRAARLLVAGSPADRRRGHSSSRAG